VTTTHCLAIERLIKRACTALLRWTFIIAAICGITGILVICFFVPDMTGVDLVEEDERFMKYLERNRWEGAVGDDEDIWTRGHVTSGVNRAGQLPARLCGSLLSLVSHSLGRVLLMHLNLFEGVSSATLKGQKVVATPKRHVKRKNFDFRCHSSSY